MQTDQQFKKGDVYYIMKGQISTGLAVAVLALVAIAATVFIFSQQVKKPQAVERTNPPVIWEPVNIPEAEPLQATTEQKQKALLDKAGISEEGSGVVTTTSQFRVNYVGPVPGEGANYFVEILDKDIDAAKQAAEQWFRDQGFTESEICQLRVTYFLSWEVRQSLPRGTRFDLLPSFCH